MWRKKIIEDKRFILHYFPLKFLTSWTTKKYYSYLLFSSLLNYTRSKHTLSDLTSSSAIASLQQSVFNYIVLIQIKEDLRDSWMLKWWCRRHKTPSASVFGCFYPSLIVNIYLLLGIVSFIIITMVCLVAACYPIKPEAFRKTGSPSHKRYQRGLNLRSFAMYSHFSVLGLASGFGVFKWNESLNQRTVQLFKNW